LAVSHPIFLDHCSTTQVDEQVLEAMLPYFREKFGNASTTHPQLGGVAERAIRKSREQVADLINCRPNEIIFTSGATESNNLAIFGATNFADRNRRHIVTQVTEHSAVLEPIRKLESQGWSVTYLSVDEYGQIDIEALRHSLNDSTALVSVMWGNNEIGTIQNVIEIGELCKSHGIQWHCDTAQSVGKVEVDLSLVQADFISVSAHKMYGPKGGGALFARDLTKRDMVAPQILGGGQEKGYRSGTLNVPAIVGLGAACDLAKHNLSGWAIHLSKLRDLFESEILRHMPSAALNGNKEQRLPHISNLSFQECDAESLLTMLPEIVASTGSACHVASFEPSHVLTALRKQPAVGDSSLRFGFGKDNTEEEVQSAVDLLCSAVDRLSESNGD
jgi:cysteine desulfurase